MIQEPMTMATDYVLAALGVWFGLRLWAAPDRAGQRSVRFWAVGFWALALAAFAGGTAHGLVDYIGELGKVATWKATVFSIGAASFCLLVGTGMAALPPVWSRRLLWLAAVKLAAFLVWMVGHDAFFYVIVDYAPGMLGAAGLGLWLWRSRGEVAGVWIALGVAISFAGAGVQMSGFALHEHFNHNDLYHVIQMFGLWCFFRGARRLRDA